MTEDTVQRKACGINLAAMFPPSFLDEYDDGSEMPMTVVTTLSLGGITTYVGEDLERFLETGQCIKPQEPLPENPRELPETPRQARRLAKIPTRVPTRSGRRTSHRPRGRTSSHRSATTARDDGDDDPGDAGDLDLIGGAR